MKLFFQFGRHITPFAGVRIKSRTSHGSFPQYTNLFICVNLAATDTRANFTAGLRPPPTSLPPSSLPAPSLTSRSRKSESSHNKCTVIHRSLFLMTCYGMLMSVSTRWDSLASYRNHLAPTPPPAILYHLSDTPGF